MNQKSITVYNKQKIKENKSTYIQFNPIKKKEFTSNASHMTTRYSRWETHGKNFMCFSLISTMPFCRLYINQVLLKKHTDAGG